MEGSTPSKTGTITLREKRISGNDQGNHITSCVNGTEVTAVFDTCSPVSTLRHSPTTKAKIIKIEHRETNSQGYRISIHPSGRQLHYPFDTIAEDSGKESEEEEYMEPASKKDILPQKPNTEEIRELLPEFNGSSALSLLEAKETWERILFKAGIHKLLWGGIILSKLRGEALLSLPPSVKRNHEFEEI